MVKNYIPVTIWGQKKLLSLVIGTYQNTCNLYIACVDEGGFPFSDITVNLTRLPDGFVALDVNNFPEGVDILEKINAIRNTGNVFQSGYCVYPVYQVSIEALLPYVSDDRRR